MKKLILALCAFFIPTIVSAQTPGSNLGGTYSFGYYYTYNGVALDITLASSPTDVACISGSATRTVIVKSINISGFTSGTDAVGHGHLLKRDTANSGGTSTTPTIVPSDTQNPPATAVLRAYTANPTLGNLVGQVYASFIAYNSTSGGGLAPTPLLNSSGNEGLQGLILRGTNENLCLNLGGTTITGGSLSATFTWIEQ